jgi:hypothetical protein
MSTLVHGNLENSKLCENTSPFGGRVSTQFLVFSISTRVDITVYQHGKCFIFVKYKKNSCFALAFTKLAVRVYGIVTVCFLICEISLAWHNSAT